MNKFVVKGVKRYTGINDNDLNPTYDVVGMTYENPELAVTEMSEVVK